MAIDFGREDKKAPTRPQIVFVLPEPGGLHERSDSGQSFRSSYNRPLNQNKSSGCHGAKDCRSLRLIELLGFHAVFDEQVTQMRNLGVARFQNVAHQVEIRKTLQRSEFSVDCAQTVVVQSVSQLQIYTYEKNLVT